MTPFLLHFAIFNKNDKNINCEASNKFDSRQRDSCLLKSAGTSEKVKKKPYLKKQSIQGHVIPNS